MSPAFIALSLAASLHATAPQPPSAATAQMPALPLSQLEERAPSPELDSRTFSLSFPEPIDVRELLLLLVRGTPLSVAADPSLSGSFVGELKNVTVRQALGLVLPPLGLDYRVDRTLVRVFAREPETRLYDIDYIATKRTGTSGIGAVESTAGDAVGVSRVSSVTEGDLFLDIERGVRTVLSPRGTFNVDRKAGLLQATDVPERLDRVGFYLDAVHDRVHRQVQIDAQVLEVELQDPDAALLDWDALVRAGGASGGVQPRSMNGVRVADTARFIAALGAQGKVTPLAAPRVLAMNNEPVVVRATTRAAPAGPGDQPRLEQEITLGVVPHIAADGRVMLSLSPILAVGVPARDGRSRQQTTTAETATLARVTSGDTIVVTGAAYGYAVREQRNAGARGGWFGRATVVTNKRVELLILLTPTVLN